MKLPIAGEMLTRIPVLVATVPNPMVIVLVAETLEVTGFKYKSA